MNINQAFPSKYLKAADLNGQAVVVTISRVVMEEVGQGTSKEQKPVVYFEGKTKGMVLNKTNSIMITRLADTPDTDYWPGTKIRLVSVEVDFQGQSTPAIRVREMPKSHAAPPPPPPPAREEAPDESEIPF